MTYSRTSNTVLEVSRSRTSNPVIEVSRSGTANPPCMTTVYTRACTDDDVWSISGTRFIIADPRIVQSEVDDKCKENGCPCCEENTCNVLGRCTIACKDGYYGFRCYHKCPSYCARCGREFGNPRYTTYQKCYKCADGFYNGTGITNCSTACPETCNKLLCDTTNGSCLNGCINENIYGAKCDQCVKGKFGTNCSLSCSVNCNDSVCSRTEGKCTYGCVSNAFEGDKCKTYVVGKYGNHCDKPCPKNCRDNLCLNINGTCATGCRGNFAGEVCNRCKDGFFSNNCTKRCLSSCLHGICNFTSGLCNECSVGWFGSYCDERCPSNCLNRGCSFKTGLCEGCKRESFGSYCNSTCSFGCKDRVCKQDSGVCLNNCYFNYSGDRCCVKSNNCMTCSSTTECKVCNIGYYGNSCQNVCPSNCENGCNIATGNCLSCRYDSYGERCNISCSPFCKKDSDKNMCDSKYGHCVFGCIEGFFSSMCNKKCSRNCLNSRCIQDKGKCEGCYQGYYGDYCDKKCGKCKNGTCHQNSSQCLYGCVGGYSDYNCMNEMEDESASKVIPAVVGSISAVAVIAPIVIIGQWIIRRRIIQVSRYQEQGQGYENTLVDIGLHDYQQLNIKDSDRENVYDIPSDKQAENEYVNTAIN